MENYVTEIHLSWDGPFEFDEIKDYETEDSEGTSARNFGIYCVYGKVALNPSGSLIYIGKTTKQGFWARIKQHAWNENPAGRDIKFRLGRLLQHDDRPITSDEADKLVSIAEALLIYALSPAKNSSSIRSLPWSQYGAVHVLNWGAYGDLLPEISGRYYCEDHIGVNDYADWTD